ncbi:MAG TPA: ABC transporter permease [Polyangia bacterium]|nr:ABC transporter permease [Polyangia bacterium]
MAEHSALYQLTMARVREAVREPGVLFWVFGFPILLSVGLGLAFRGRGPEPIVVGLLDGPGAVAVERTLVGAGLRVERLDEPAAKLRLRAGKVALLVVPGATADAPLTYRYDPTPPESRLARAAVDTAIQRAAGRRDPRDVRDQPVTEPGSRYIDFLVPGLLGMNLMSGSMWGIGWVIVDMRVRKLLKRLLATPVRRRDLLLSQAIARVGSLPLEVGTLVVFARLAFNVHVTGSWLALGLVALVGALAFAGLAILVASRAQNTQTVSGLMNLVMMPMFVLSGVFFASSHFPDAVQPVLQLLPLTALNDGLRAVMIDGAGLLGVAKPLAILSAWGVASFAAGVRIFRWG